MKSLQLSFDYCVHSKKEIEGNRTYLYEEGETLLIFNISLNDNFNFQSWCKILYLRSFGFGCLESHGFVGGGRIIYTTVVGFVNRAFPQPLSRDDAAQAERPGRRRIGSRVIAIIFPPSTAELNGICSRLLQRVYPTNADSSIPPRFEGQLRGSLESVEHGYNACRR